jgi:hypothetical protein
MCCLRQCIAHRTVLQPDKPDAETSSILCEAPVFSAPIYGRRGDDETYGAFFFPPRSLTSSVIVPPAATL